MRTTPRRSRTRMCTTDRMPAPPPCVCPWRHLNVRCHLRHWARAASARTLHSAAVALFAQKEISMPSLVTQVPAADSASAVHHFETAFGFETDCWDVHEAIGRGRDFVLVDVRS